MARIPMPHEDDPATTPEAKDWLKTAGASRGQLLNIYRALGNRPETGHAFLAMVNTVYRTNSTLQPRHGELAYLTATVVNNCYY
jgi:alkylhydroperoxidase family enzyme